MDWRRGRVLGRGSTATVSLATSPTKSTTTTRSIITAAVKSAPLSKSQPLRHEHHLFSSILTPNPTPYIVTYLGHNISNSSYNLFFEYLPAGNLTQHQINHEDPTTAQLYTWRILKGLHHLHTLGIVHGDIKPTNILIAPAGPKITDLGCARKLNSLSSHFSGTPLYMAPEVARGEEQNTASDIWSFGCTIVEMLTGESPWSSSVSTSPVSVMYRIGHSFDKPEVPEWLCDEGKDFLKKCLRREARERWTAEELLRHPYVNWLSHQSDDEDEDEEELVFGCDHDWSLREEEEEDEDDDDDSCRCGGGGRLMTSPTSVLEQQGLLNSWTSVAQEEQPTTTLNLGERIKGLSSLFHHLGDEDEQQQQLHRWELDDNDWITIR